MHVFDVPPGWKSVPMWSVASRKDRKGYSNAELLSVYREYGVIRKSDRDDNHNVESEDLSNYKFVKKGDLVLNKMKTWQGSLGVSPFEGIVSPAYYVCEISKDLHTPYIHYLLRSAPYIAMYGARSKGIRVGQWDLPYEEFREIPVLLPPIHEQRRIADYLDDQLSKIDLLIELKMQQMDLNRQLLGSKFAEIFLGQSNDVIPIKRLLRDEQLGVWGDEPGESEIDVSVARVADFNRFSFTLDLATTVRSITKKQFISRKVSKGDLLLERSGGGEKSPVGCAVFVNIDQEYLVSSNFVSRLRPAHNVHARYLSFLFAALYMTGRQTPHSSQTTGIQNLDTDSFFQIQVPKLDLNQQVFATKIADKIISDITNINSRIESSIEGYRALKNAITTSSVMGHNTNRESVSR